jgi:hypothetical protein
MLSPQPIAFAPKSKNHQSCSSPKCLTGGLFICKAPSRYSLPILDLEDTVLAHIEIGNLCALACIKMIDCLAKESFAFDGFALARIRNRAKSARAKKSQQKSAKEF